MATIVNEQKNARVTLTRLDKDTTKTWDEAPETWDETKSPYIWDSPRELFTKEAKNAKLTISKQSKDTSQFDRAKFDEGKFA